MSESLLPASPSLDEPLEMLDACHERIESRLQTLERLAAYLPDHGNDEQARQAARSVLRYFEQAGPNHHEDEEQDLFPRLIERAAPDEATEVRALIADLLSDHVHMAAAVDAVRRQLIPIAGGQGAVLDGDAVRRMATVYRVHIEKETQHLLPLARRLLTARDIDGLSRAMTARRGAPGIGR